MKIKKNESAHHLDLRTSNNATRANGSIDIRNHIRYGEALHPLQIYNQRQVYMVFLLSRNNFIDC